MNDRLLSIRDFAAAAHEGQLRRFEEGPYIVHPVRVMERCAEYTNATPILAAALLHDVVEDTSVTAEELHRFLLTVLTEKEAIQTSKLVEELTDVYLSKNYPYWNRRKRKSKEADRLASTSSEAQTIKYADIIDNSRSFAGTDDGFVQVYLKEAQTLLSKMQKGNPQLRQLAIDTIDKYLSDLDR